MPRAHKQQIPLLAASPSLAAAMLGLHYQDLLDAITRGDLKACQIGKRRRVIIADAVEWLRTNPPSGSIPKHNGVSHADNHAS
jgi:hypothetical protein